MAASIPAQDICSLVDLHLQCNDLPDLDTISKSDPQIRVYLRDRSTGGEETLIGETETILDNLNPQFAKAIPVKYYFEETQHLRFECIDVDKHGFDMVGNVTCTLADIVGGRGGELARIFQQPHGSKRYNKHGKKPVLIVRADERQGGQQHDIKMEFYAKEVDKMKWFFGKSDPFLEIHRVNPNGSETLVYRSEYRRRTLHPQWKTFTITNNTLCLNDPKKALIFRVLDWNKSGSHVYIGECRTSLEGLTTGKERQWDLINESKKAKNKSYVNSGVLHLAQLHITPIYSFLEYIISGLQINLVVGIDFTASNGNPADINSLHFRGPQGNQYSHAIASIAQILLAYDSDGLVPVYGFGGKLSNGVISHCFPLTGDPAKPEVFGTEGILNTYNNAFAWVTLHGPTNFAPLINQVADTANKLEDTQQDLPTYMILLIITDGEITDMANTTDAIVRISNLPVSIIIIGVGNADFTKMDILDGDNVRLRDGRGRAAARDIVQFVPFNRFCHDATSLAAAVLKEVPGQVTSYFKSKGIPPRQRSAPSPHELSKLLNNLNLEPRDAVSIQQKVFQASAPFQEQQPHPQQQQLQQQPPYPYQQNTNQNRSSQPPPQRNPYPSPYQVQQQQQSQQDGNYGWTLNNQ